MAMMTLYDVLGVSPDADPETIKQAFRKAVKAHHPDLQGGDAAASRRVITANASLLTQQAALYRHLAIRRQRAVETAARHPSVRSPSWSERGRALAPRKRG